MNMEKIYAISLCNYDEENVPECCATIFVKSAEDLTKVPVHVLKENASIAEALYELGCEGISNVFESSEDEREFYGDDFGLIDFNI